MLLNSYDHFYKPECILNVINNFTMIKTHIGNHIISCQNQRYNKYLGYSILNNLRTYIGY